MHFRYVLENILMLTLMLPIKLFDEHGFGGLVVCPQCSYFLICINELAVFLSRSGVVLSPLDVHFCL